MKKNQKLPTLIFLSKIRFERNFQAYETSNSQNKIYHNTFKVDR